MITPTCQKCGTTLDFSEGEPIDVLVSRGTDDSDDWLEDEGLWDWHQQLRYQFCGEDHMKSWLAEHPLPPFAKSPGAETGFGWSVLGALAILLVLQVLVGAGYGWVLLIQNVL